MTLLRSARSILLALSLASLAAAASAQGHGGPGGGGKGGGMPGFGGGGGMDRGGMDNAGRAPSLGSGSQGSLRLGPIGRWWDNKNVALLVGLEPRQQHRMDDVFTANRDSLIKSEKALQHEQSQLNKLTRSKEVDENQIFQQIDRVTQARGELEKTYTHYLLQIRHEMTPEQTAKLDEFQATQQ